MSTGPQAIEPTSPKKFSTIAKWYQTNLSFSKVFLAPGRGLLKFYYKG